ncbi:hypothetical protein GGTG_04939 [Gaeumannomyces tritici R3-111a-1]|uniref:Importin N-terminal domain-containing protein n=1 Tax=Gaeumannomyces tritici (strain R3-111a-1) TaxID=644352 RepID=J3NUI3_GAET3|nr:hypothetical protein GGTG_04939 [Gaeumannomyces tritici R3-111a-1]EJT79856.1 hypothetical protein GGTG_04939 [Gaeumannomyces tritici R3-111a-1]
MDPATVRNCVLATLDPVADIRKRGELELKQAEQQPGFIDCLVNILEADQAPDVRLGTVIYLKNRVNRAWSSEQNLSNEPTIPEDEKTRFKDRLLPLLAASQGTIRQNLVPVLQRILHWDYPEKWPAFMNYTVELLGTNDKDRVLAGLQCLLAICRAYRFKPNDVENQARLRDIVEASFPRLLEICRELVVQESDDAGEMLHIALKAYKHATFLDLPGSLMNQDVNMSWCDIFLRTAARGVPATAMVDDGPEREKHHWWKAKKWALYNLNRLYQRHGNPEAFSKEAKNQIKFAQEFSATIAPAILKHYLAEIEKWVAKTAWLSRPCLSYIIVFLDECVKPKEMWTHLKPDLNNLIQHFIFPVLCLSEDDVLNFEDQPEEYLHRKLNFYEEVSSPDVSATNFLVNLTKHRRKQTFEVLTFINNVVNEYEQAPEGNKNHIAKEGALRMIGTLAPVLLSKKSPIADQVEYFIVRYVFPDFTSTEGFLRARACDTIEKFEQLNFKDQNNLLTIYRHILECMADPALPVRVTAALALQPLIRHDIIRRSMQTNIPTIMQQLLKLANEADIDALANVMEDFVEVFAKELTPFAVALSQQLRDTYLRIVRELLEKNGGRDDADDYNDFLDDKSITALGVLQTIGTLILTLESTPEVLQAIEAILMPVIEITLENKLYDLYNEVFEIIDSCTFAAKAISPIMWKAFEHIHRTFKSGAELYLEDMLPALDNFVQYGAPHLVQSPEYTHALFDMVKVMFEDSKVGNVDRICACKLAEAMMLSLRGHIDNYIEGFITMAMNIIMTQDLKNKSVKIHLMEMVINAIYYHPTLALQILEAKGWTNKFFSLWFSSMENFSRVHDKKLCIVAIVALLGINPDQIPPSVSIGWPRLLQGITILFRTLPNAEKNRAEALKDDYTLDAGTYDYEEEDEWDEDEANWNADETAEEEQPEVKDESTAYLQFLDEEAQKFGSLPEGHESDDELGEHSLLLETPLEKLEPYQIFRTALLRLQQEQPQFYSSLAGHLSPEEQNLVQGVVNQAEALILVQQQQQQQALAQAASNGGAS